jgi:transcriptional regulator with XRE-family HTH domain
VRQRQKRTLAQLAAPAGYDPAVLSRLLTGRQTNPTLATVGRIARALGKAVVHALCDLPAASRKTGPTKGKGHRPEARARLASGRNGETRRLLCMISIAATHPAGAGVQVGFAEWSIVN